jgi:hypothetical protein
MPYEEQLDRNVKFSQSLFRPVPDPPAPG